MSARAENAKDELYLALYTAGMSDTVAWDWACSDAPRRLALARALVPERAVVPRKPTEAMHNAARDWSLRKYGQGIGKEASDGCYRAMLAASEPTR